MSEFCKLKETFPRQWLKISQEKFKKNKVKAIDILIIIVILKKI